MKLITFFTLISLLTEDVDVVLEMSTRGDSRKFKPVYYIAASHLEQLGYHVLKTVTRSLIFDLVAFNEKHTLFITIRRGKIRCGKNTTNSTKEIVRDYQEIITEMQQIQVSHYIEKQFWVYRNDRFEIYKLFEKGIIKTHIGTV